MGTVLRLARAYVLFMAVVFLLGQVLTGTLSPGGALAGAAGGVAVWLSRRLAARPGPRAALGACVAASLLGVGLHAHEYYSAPHARGSYYAWVLVGPFVVALLLLGRGALPPVRIRSPRP